MIQRGTYQVIAHAHSMNQNNDIIYLERLNKRLQGILRVLDKQKPSSDHFTRPEIRALLAFHIDHPKSLSPSVKRIYKETLFIPLLPHARRESGIYFLQIIQTSALRLKHLFKEVENKKLKEVQKELRANNVITLKRRDLEAQKDKAFEGLITAFLKKGGAFNDNKYENIAMLSKRYLSLLDYYLTHKKEISGTKQWYDFLVISNYMFFGAKLELFQLQKLRKCYVHRSNRFK